jgi:aminopeptidase
MTHERLLDSYAELTVKTGLNLQRGQQLLITAPLDAVPLVRRITEHAYKVGASLVTCVYADDETTLARYRFAPDDAFDVAPSWLFNGMAPPAWPSPARTRRCSQARTRRSFPAPTRHAPRPTARRSNSSPASPSTGA